MTTLKDNRAYIQALEAIGEIQEINAEADWNLEIGAICRHALEIGAPAPLFNRIKGIEPGFRVLGNPAGISRQPDAYYARIAVSLGLPPTASAADIINLLAQWETLPARIPPTTVPSGPCKDNQMLGDTVDLLRFPTPLIHPGDGGRYFGTWGILIAQTPDKSWTNWSIQRCMLRDKNTLNVNIPGGTHGKHAAMIFSEWQAQKKPMPFAIVQGVEPMLPFVCGMPLPDRVNEADVVGGFVGRGVQVVNCETVDLQVPASAEIVIEGTISPDDQTLEGPMGEYTGYLQADPQAYKPVMNVTAVTFRNDPILPVVAAGEPVEENHTCWGTGIAAVVLGELRKQGFPVTMCFSPFESACHWLVVTIDTTHKHGANDPNAQQFVRDLGQAVFSTRAGRTIPKVIVVHDDVDPSNLKEVVWAFATRCHPDEGEIHFPNQQTNPLEVLLHDTERQTAMSTKTVYNCLFQDRSPLTPIQRASFKWLYTKELQDKVLTNWNALGYR